MFLLKCIKGHEMIWECKTDEQKTVAENDRIIVLIIQLTEIRY